MASLYLSITHDVNVTCHGHIALANNVSRKAFSPELQQRYMEKMNASNLWSKVKVQCQGGIKTVTRRRHTVLNILRCVSVSNSVCFLIQ